ncbi:MAG: HPF/RaiA family ribosome-associated protein [Burkholderiales bacterium]|nr:MAG: HPF/RaiA family ribosome-associated protein [Burkholderiales bacterium]
MQVLVNTNHSIEGREALERWASTELNEGLARFKNDLTRVEVHLSDENSAAGGADDKRCLMEARLPNHAPLAVSNHASGIDEAFRGALTKLRHALDSTLGRQKNHRDRESIRHDADLGVDETT